MKTVPTIKAEILRRVHNRLKAVLAEEEKLMSTRMKRTYKKPTGEAYESCHDLCDVHEALRKLDSRIKEFDPNQ